MSSDNELEALIKPVWLAAKPSREAQGIRATLCHDIDELDLVPDYIWSLLDIAAQRGIDLGKQSEMPRLPMDRTRFKGMRP